jgi:hypothetical protein
MVSQCPESEPERRGPERPLFMLAIDALLADLAVEIARYQVGPRGSTEIAHAVARILISGAMLEALASDPRFHEALRPADAALLDAAEAKTAPYTYTKNKRAPDEDETSYPKTKGSSNSNTAHTPAPSVS